MVFLFCISEYYVKEISSPLVTSELLSKEKSDTLYRIETSKLSSNYSIPNNSQHNKHGQFFKRLLNFLKISVLRCQPKTTLRVSSEVFKKDLSLGPKETSLIQMTD